MRSFRKGGDDSFIVEVWKNKKHRHSIYPINEWKLEMFSAAELSKIDETVRLIFVDQQFLLKLRYGKLVESNPRDAVRILECKFCVQFNGETPQLCPGRDGKTSCLFFTSNGNLRKDIPPRSNYVKLVKGNAPFSQNNVTALDFWTEYKHGSNGIYGGRSLESLENEHGTRWRSWCSGVYKMEWWGRNMMHEFIEWNMRDGATEDDAVAVAQEIMQEVLNSKKKDKSVTARTVLKECAPKFKAAMNKLATKENEEAAKLDSELLHRDIEIPGKEGDDNATDVSSNASV